MGYLFDLAFAATFFTATFFADRTEVRPDSADCAFLGSLAFTSVRIRLLHQGRQFSVVDRIPAVERDPLGTGEIRRRDHAVALTQLCKRLIVTLERCDVGRHLLGARQNIFPPTLNTRSAPH